MSLRVHVIRYSTLESLAMQLLLSALLRIILLKDINGILFALLPSFVEIERIFYGP